MSKDAPHDGLQEHGERVDRLTERIERIERQLDQVIRATGTQDEAHLPHPVRSVEHEVEHLRRVADAGESAETPAILAAGVLAVLVPIAALLIAAAFLIPILVTR